MTVTSKSQPVLVSFSGIDGAGKSTQIDHLLRHLHEHGLSTRLLSFWDDAAALKSLREGAGHRIFKGDKGVGSPDAPIERRDKNIRSPFMSAVRAALYFLDALSLRQVVKRALASGADVVIFDRYIYDEFANMNLESAVACLYVRTLMKLVPKPAFGFVLDANPVDARARKPEYPLEFLISNRDMYLRLTQVLGGMLVIPAGPLAEAKAEVVRYFPPSLFGRVSLERCVKVTPIDSQSDSKKELDGDGPRPIAI
jgi:thymidylate kinase